MLRSLISACCLAVFLAFAGGSAFATNCVGVVYNAPNCDTLDSQCQTITLPNSNTFTVWIENEPWTAAGIEALASDRQYYFVRVTHDKDGLETRLRFVEEADIVGVALTPRGLRIIQTWFAGGGTGDTVHRHMFRTGGAQELGTALDSRLIIAALAGHRRLFLFDGVNLTNRISSARGQVVWPACV